MENTVPFVSLYDQMSRMFDTMTISGMKAVEHEDNEFNSDYSVDPLADPRLDKMDLFNMVDSEDRDAVMNATPSYVSNGGDFDDPSMVPVTSKESTSDSGSGE